MTLAEIKQSILNDVVFVGIRSAIGVIFIVHGMMKFNPGFLGFMEQLGLPPETQVLIALAEIVPGILLIIGVLSRFSSVLLSVIMVVAIFHIKGAQSIAGDGGVEFDLILLASLLVIMIAGPGRISLSQIIKKLPRFIH